MRQAASAKACAANGTAVLQIDTVPNEQLSPKPVAKERFTLTDTGAWTYKAHQLKIARSYAGCLGAAELASLRSKMARVPWTLTHLDVTCAAIPTTFTTYTVEGKARYTQAMCSGDTLDAASQQVVGEINTLVGKLIAPHAATGK